MRPLVAFLACLAPLIIGYGAILMFGEKAIEFAMILIILGTGVSGSCVVAQIHLGMEPKGVATANKVFLGILAFLGTGAGYLAIGLAGCCGVASAVG